MIAGLLAVALASMPVASAADRALSVGDAGAEATGAPLQVQADHIVVEGDVARGEGAVSLRLDGQQVRAASFSLHLGTGALILVDGEWSRDGGPVRFARAEISMGDASGLLLAARAEGAAGRWRLEAGSLRWEPGGDTAAATDARLSLCACEAPPWSVTARRVDVRLDEVATFRAGWLEVCGRRAVPLPLGGVALSDRRTGLLAPEASWGRDGFVLGAPVMLRLGEHADAVVTPEWRQARGGRAAAELRYALAPGEGGTVRVAGGPDALEGAWRGQAAVDHGWAPGNVRTALRGGWVSDPGVFTDFGEDLLARTAPWAELLGVAGVGPLRVEMDRFTADAVLPQRPVSVAATTWGQRIGGVAVGGGARVDALGAGTGLAPVAEPILRPLGELGAQTGRWIGPARVDLGGRAQVSQPLGARAARVQGRARAQGALGLWGDVGGVRHLAELGVAADVGAARGAAARLPDERSPRPWGVGPVLRSTWLTPRAAPISLRAAAPWTPRGVAPEAASTVRLGAWSGRVQGSRRLQAGALSWDDGGGSVGAGLVHRDDLLWADARGAWTLPGALRTLRPGYAARLDVPAGTLLGHGPSLRWTSGCDCLRVDAAAQWSADRAVPDVRVQLQLR